MNNQKSTLKKQLNRTYMFAIFLPIFLIGTYLIYNNYTLIMSHHEAMLHSENLRVRSIVFEVTTSMTNICDNIAEDKPMAALLTTEFTNKEKALEALNNGTVVNEFYGRHTELSSVTIYTTNQTLVNHEHIKVLTPLEQKASWYQKAIERAGYYWHMKSRTDHYGVTYHELELTYKLPIDRDDMEALLVITVSNNYLENRINNNELDARLIDDTGMIFYDTKGQEGFEETFPIDFGEPYFYYSDLSDHGGERLLTEISSFRPIRTDDRIYIVSTNPNAVSESRKILYVTMTTIFLSLLIPLIIIVKYNGQLSNRITTLKHEMHRVTEGNYDIIETFKGNDELVELFNDLKQMIVSIKSRDQAIYDARIKEQLLINHQQKMEMALLSSKINPHFLYNTLETIRMKAFALGAKEVADAVKLLGQYMRHNLEHSGEVVSLQTELQFIEVYLAIQKLRFSNRITYQIDVDATVDTSKVMVLPLMIQPIVENAILHGHEETTEKGIINLCVVPKEKDLILSVKDNGTGISQERLMQVRERIEIDPEELKQSIGLANIHQRLKLYYGNNYGIMIENNDMGGTTVSIKIPYENTK